MATFGDRTSRVSYSLVGDVSASLGGRRRPGRWGYGPPAPDPGRRRRTAPLILFPAVPGNDLLPVLRAAATADRTRDHALHDPRLRRPGGAHRDGRRRHARGRALRQAPRRA